MQIQLFFIYIQENLWYNNEKQYPAKIQKVCTLWDTVIIVLDW